MVQTEIHQSPVILPTRLTGRSQTSMISWEREMYRYLHVDMEYDNARYLIMQKGGGNGVKIIGIFRGGNGKLPVTVITPK